MLIPQFLRRKISLLLTIDDWIKDRQGTTAGTAPSAHILEFGPPVLAGVDLLVAVAESVERVQGQTLIRTTPSFVAARSYQPGYVLLEHFTHYCMQSPASQPSYHASGRYCLGGTVFLSPFLNSENDIRCSSEFRMLLGRVSGLIAFNTSSNISFCFFLAVSKVFASSRKLLGVVGVGAAGWGSPLDGAGTSAVELIGAGAVAFAGFEETCRSSASGGRVLGRILGVGPRESSCSSLDLKASRGLLDESSSVSAVVSTRGAD